MKSFTVIVKTEYTIEIDENNDIVKEYKNEDELIEDCISYRFNAVLPVISDGGVKVKDEDIVHYSFKTR